MQTPVNSYSKPRALEAAEQLFAKIRVLPAPLAAATRRQVLEQLERAESELQTRDIAAKLAWGGRIGTLRHATQV